MGWRDLVVYGVFMLTPFITFPFILITAERRGARALDDEGDG